MIHMCSGRRELRKCQTAQHKLIEKIPVLSHFNHPGFQTAPRKDVRHASVLTHGTHQLRWKMKVDKANTCDYNNVIVTGRYSISVKTQNYVSLFTTYTVPITGSLYSVLCDDRDETRSKSIPPMTVSQTHLSLHVWGLSHGATGRGGLVTSLSQAGRHSHQHSRQTRNLNKPPFKK